VREPLEAILVINYGCLQYLQHPYIGNCFEDQHTIRLRRSIKSCKTVPEKRSKRHVLDTVRLYYVVAADHHFHGETWNFYSHSREGALRWWIGPTRGTRVLTPASVVRLVNSTIRVHYRGCGHHNFSSLYSRVCPDIKYLNAPSKSHWCFQLDVTAFESQELEKVERSAAISSQRSLTSCNTTK
jgi:hypothetical protein